MNSDQVHNFNDQSPVKPARVLGERIGQHSMCKVEDRQPIYTTDIKFYKVCWSKTSRNINNKQKYILS